MDEEDKHNGSNDIDGVCWLADDGLNRRFVDKNDNSNNNNSSGASTKSTLLLSSELTTPLLLLPERSEDTSRTNNNNNNNDDVEQQQQQQHHSSSRSVIDTAAPATTSGSRWRRSSRSTRRANGGGGGDGGGGTRLLDRTGTFHQSRGRWGIERISRSQSSSSSRSRRRRRSISQMIDDDDDIDDDGNIIGPPFSSSNSNTNYHHPNAVRNNSRMTSSRFSSCCGNNGCCRKAVQCVRYCCPWCFWCLCQCGPVRKFFRVQWGKDWFFYLAYQKTCVLFMLLFTTYTVIVCFFGFVYLGLSILGSKSEVNPDGSTKTIAFCDMDINDHMEAMYFSLSTMTTIGYGVSDYYFGGCYSPLLIVLWQVCTAIVFDAVAVGLIFHRISRGAKRSRTILFSDMAVVRRVGGIPYLMFRLGERRQYHLIEATVRCYCVRHTRLAVPVVANSMTDTTIHDGPTRRYNTKNQRNGHQPGPATSSDDRSLTTPMRIETTHFVSRQMRLVHPDDQYGSHVWMGLPQIVVHRLDDSSPLVPQQPYWFDSQGRSHPNPCCRTMERSGRTASDDCSASRTTKQYLDPLDTFATTSNTSTASHDNANLSNDIGRTPSSTKPPPPSSSSANTDIYNNYENNLEQGFSGRSSHDDLDSIYAFLDDRDAEIVVLVEGTDEVTGAAIQARHSYKVNDIALNHTFADCVFPYNRRQRRGRSADNDPVVSIDFSKFHDVTPAPLDCVQCAYIPT